MRWGMFWRHCGLFLYCGVVESGNRKVSLWPWTLAFVPTFKLDLHWRSITYFNKSNTFKKDTMKRDVAKYIFIISPQPSPLCGLFLSPNPPPPHHNGQHAVLLSRTCWYFLLFISALECWFCFKSCVCCIITFPLLCIFSVFVRLERLCELPDRTEFSQRGLNIVSAYRKKTSYLWYPENLFSSSYITCGATVLVSV